MKRKTKKENFLAGRKMIVWAIVCAMLLACMSGCGEKQEADVSEQKVEDTVAEVEKETEVLEESESVTDTEKVVAVGEEDLMVQRLTELGLQEVCVVVWNEENGTEHVIKEGERYQNIDGDRYFICTPSFMIQLDSYISTTGKFGFEKGDPEDNYREIYFYGYEGENKVEWKIDCENGEQGKINFTILAGGTPEIPEGCDYYLESSTDVKLLGANTPEGFEDLGSTPRLLLWIDGDENINVTTSSSHKDIFEGLASNISGENELTVNGEETTFSYSEDYSEKGTYDTIYGQAYLYDLVSTEQYSGEEATIMYGEMAILLIKGEYVTINYYFVDDHTHDIVWVLQQLFE